MPVDSLLRRASYTLHVVHVSTGRCNLLGYAFEVNTMMMSMSSSLPIVKMGLCSVVKQIRVQGYLLTSSALQAKDTLVYNIYTALSSEPWSWHTTFTLNHARTTFWVSKNWLYFILFTHYQSMPNAKQKPSILAFVYAASKAQ